VEAAEKKLEAERAVAAQKAEDEARALLQENAEIVKNLTEAEFNEGVDHQREERHRRDKLLHNEA